MRAPDLGFQAIKERTQSQFHFISSYLARLLIPSLQNGICKLEGKQSPSYHRKHRIKPSTYVGIKYWSSEFLRFIFNYEGNSSPSAAAEALNVSLKKIPLTIHLHT